MNLENNFWEEYPQIRLHDIFAKMYNADKSEEKKESSRIMWGIHLYVHPDSPMYKNPDKGHLIARDHINRPEFEWEDYEDHMVRYKESVLSVAQQSLYEWDEIIRARTKMLKEMFKKEMEKETVDTKALKDIDAMLGNTPKLYKEYAEIKRDLEAESLNKGRGTIHVDDI